VDLGELWFRQRY